MVDALAVWFDLLLDPSTSLSTAPTSPTSSWDQAIFPLWRELRVESGDVVGVTASCSDTQLRLQVTEVQRSRSGTIPLQNGEANQQDVVDSFDDVSDSSE